MNLKTPLYDTHVKLKGKIVPFGGYLLPVNYESGIIAEHMAVRKSAGLFDVSHMGELSLTGEDAFSNLQRLFTNDFSGMKIGQIKYTMLCYESGGTVDDLLVYKVADDDYMLVVNASNKDKDFEYIKSHISGDVDFRDLSDETGLIALQGPASEKILKNLLPEEHIPQKYYTFKNAEILGVPAIISRTGYTGEDGFEIYTGASDITALFERTLEAGEEYSILPCGLGSRDTLRLEASMPLYGHELSKDITPIEAGLSFCVKMNKDDFLGKSGLLARGESKIKRIGLELIDRGIAREGAKVLLNGKEIGLVTSGTMAPYLSKSVAMAMVEKEFSEPGTILDVDVRGRILKAKIVKMPFYKRV